MALSGQEIKRGLRLSVVEGSFATVHIQLTGGIFLSGFALFLSATDLEISLLSALPALLTPLGFLAVPLISLTGSRKQVTVFTAGLGRGLFLIPALVLLLGGKMNMSSLLVIIGFFNALLVITGNTWTSWMSDLVPRERWGRYFGLRNTVIGIVGMAVSYSGAWLLDIFKKNDVITLGFGWVFLAAGIASIVSALLLGVQPHPSQTPQPYRFVETLSEPLKDKKFRKLLIFIAFWYVTSGVASPFYGVHMLGNLKMPYSQAAIYGVAAGITGLVFQMAWGRVIDRIHPKPVLQINFFGIAFLPFMWLFARPDFLLPIWVDSVLTGIFWTGVNAALFNIMLGSVSEARLKESYIALFSAVTGISGFVSASLGGLIAESLGGFEFTLWGQKFINYHVLFAAASLFRFASLPLLARVEEGQKIPGVRYTLASIGDYTLQRLTMGKELNLKTLNLFARRPKDQKGGTAKKSRIVKP